MNKVAVLLGACFLAVSVQARAEGPAPVKLSANALEVLSAVGACPNEFSQLIGASDFIQGARIEIAEDTRVYVITGAKGGLFPRDLTYATAELRITRTIVPNPHLAPDQPGEVKFDCQFKTLGAP